MRPLVDVAGYLKQMGAYPKKRGYVQRSNYSFVCNECSGVIWA
jgi:hypothetical protein